MGFNTFFRKKADTKFVVKNTAPKGKRIKIFNYPIINGQVRDLLTIPYVSEDVIRHSLLKGELFNKIKHNEIKVIESNIELIQFDDSQKKFLEDAGISVGLEVTPDQISGHDSVRQLIHFIDSGPASGFASGAFREQLPTGDPFYTSSTWWESSDKNQKIVELTLTRDGEQRPILEEWKMYAEDGITVLAKVTDTVVYSNQVEVNRVRVIE